MCRPCRSTVEITRSSATLRAIRHWPSGLSEPVRRFYHAEVPPRVEYEITDLGASLAPVFAQLTAWGAASADVVEKARTDYDAKALPVRRRS